MTLVTVTVEWRFACRPITDSERLAMIGRCDLSGQSMALIDANDGRVLAWCRDLRHAQSTAVQMVAAELPFDESVVRS